MSETETEVAETVNPDVLAGFENLTNVISTAGFSTEFGSPQYALLAKTNKAVKAAWEAYAAGPKARKTGGRRGRPRKVVEETTETAEAAE